MQTEVKKKKLHLVVYQSVVYWRLNWGGNSTTPVVVRPQRFTHVHTLTQINPSEHKLSPSNEREKCEDALLILLECDQK